MNFVKSKLRNRMQGELLNAVLAVRYGLKRNDQVCSSYVIPKEVIKNVRKSIVYSAAPIAENEVPVLVVDDDDWLCN